MRFKKIPCDQNSKKHLLSSFQNDRLSHAHLFLGDDGSSSLAMAWAFAQYLLCTCRSKNDSCGECSSCLKSASLNHPDIHWVFPIVSSKGKNPTSDLFMLDWRNFLTQNNYPNEEQWFSHLGAENKQGFIGIGDALSLNNKLVYKPFLGGWRVIIIWHSEKMLSGTANKLLKLLEEPPQKTIFILLCSRKELLLDTIVSRLQCFQIKNPNMDVLSSFLQEKFSSTKEEADRCSKLSNCNIGKAIGFLIGNEMTAENVGHFKAWARMCYQAKVVALSVWVEKATLWGREQQKGFLQYVLHVIRESLMQNIKTETIKNVSAEESVFIENFAPYIHQNNVVELIDEVESALNHISRNGNSKIIFMDLTLKVIVLLHVKNITLHKKQNK